MSVKLLLFLGILCCASFSLGNECQQASTVAPPAVLSGTTVNQATLGFSCGDDFYNKKGVWYKVDTSYSSYQSLTIKTCNSCYDTMIHVYQGPSCDAVACIASNDDSWSMSCPLDTCDQFNSLWSSVDLCVSTTSFWILVTGYENTAGEFVLTLEEGTACSPPANDLCTNAIPVSLDSPVSFSTQYASGEGHSCNYVLSSNSVWYTFLGTGGSIAVSTCGSSIEYSSVLVFSGSCGDLSCVAGNSENYASCGDGNAYSIFCSEDGVEYYIAVSSVDSVQGGGNLTLSQISSTCIQPIGGETCASSISLQLGSAVSASTVDLFYTNPLPACDDSPIGTTGMMWFTFVGDGNLYNFTTCDSDYDTVLTVFKGDCDYLQCLGFNDDFCNYQSSIELCTAFGIRYYLVAGGFFGETGTLQLTSTTNLGHCDNGDNSFCEHSETLYIPATIRFDTSSATENTNLPESCLGFSRVNPRTLWYTIIGTGTVLDISTCESCYDTTITVYQTASNSCEDLICLDANDDHPYSISCDATEAECDSYSFLTSALSFCSSENVQYLIAVSGYSTDNGEGILSVSVTDEECVGNDECIGAILIGELQYGDLLATPDMTNATGGLMWCQVFELSHSVWYLVIGDDYLLSISAYSTNNMQVSAAVFGSTTNDCGNLDICVGGGFLDDFSDEVSFCATSGNKYWIMLGSDDTSRLYLTVTNSTSPCSVAPNFECGSRQVLTAPATVSGNILDAPGGLTFPTCNGVDFLPPQYAWYSVTGTGNTLMASVCSSATDFDTVLGVFEYTDCESNICVTALDDSCGFQSSISWCSITDVEYLVLLGSYPFSAAGNFELEVTEGTACSVSPCDHLTTISGLPYSFSGTTDSPAQVDMVKYNLDGSCTGYSTLYANSDWFLFTPAENRQIRIDTCGSDYDTVLAVFNNGEFGCQPSYPYTCIEGNDQREGSSSCGRDTSLVHLCGFVGQYYLIMVGGYLNEVGDYDLSLEYTNVTCVSNIYPTIVCNYAPEVLPPSVIVGSTLNAPGSFYEIQCVDSRNFVGNAWFETTGSGMRMTFDICDSSPLDSKAFVLTGTCGHQECVAVTETCSVSWCGIPGETYYIALGSFDGSRGAYEASLLESEACIGSPDPPGEIYASAKTDSHLGVTWSEPFSFDFPIFSYHLSLYDSNGLLYEETAFSCNLTQCSFDFPIDLSPDTEYSVTITATNRWGTGDAADFVTSTFSGNCFPSFQIDMEELDADDVWDFTLRGNVMTLDKNAVLNTLEVYFDPVYSWYVWIALYGNCPAYPDLFEKIHVQGEWFSSFNPADYYTFSDLGWNLCEGRQYFVAIIGYIEIPQTNYEDTGTSVCTSEEMGVHLPALFQGTFREEFWLQFDITTAPYSMRYDLDVDFSDHSNSPPGMVVIEHVYVSTHSLSIVWDTPCSVGGSVISYTLTVTDGSLFTSTVTVDSTFTTEYAFNNLEAETEYTVSIYAENVAGQGPVSQDTVTTLTSKYAVEWLEFTSKSITSQNLGVAQGTDVTMDEDGNMYVVGSFCGLISLTTDSSTIVLQSKELISDCFLLKYSASPSHSLLWAVHIGGSGIGDTTCSDVAVGPNGNIVVGGIFSNDISFDGADTTTVAVPGDDNGYVAVLNSSGALQWMKHCDSTSGYCYITGVAVDAQNNVLATGYVDGFLDLHWVEDSVSESIASWKTGFVTVWSDDSTFVDMHLLEGAELDYISPTAIDLEADGSVVVIGTFDNIIVSGDYLLSHNFNSCSPTSSYSWWWWWWGYWSSWTVWFDQWFILKIERQTFTGFGDTLWLRGVGNCDHYCSPTSVSVGSDGYVYVGGEYEGSSTDNSVYFYEAVVGVLGSNSSSESSTYWPVASQLIKASDAAEYGPLVVQIDLVSGDFVWATSICTLPQDGLLQSVTAMENGIFAVAGYYTNELTLIDTGYDGHPFPDVASDMGYLIVYDSLGEIQWTRWMGSLHTPLWLSGIAYQDSRLYGTGTFQGSSSFDCEVSLSTSTESAFIVSLAEIPGSVVQVDEEECNELTVLTGYSGSVTYPLGNAAYSNHVLCSWLIQPLDVYHITVTIHAFDLFDGDSLTFYDGDNTDADYIITYDGSAAYAAEGEYPIFFNNYEDEARMRVLSTEPSMLISFLSDQCYRGYGFSFTYESSPKIAHCDNDFTIVSVLQEGFLSEDPAGGYRNNADCYYLIQPEFDTNVIVAKFEKWDVAVDDCITLYDGETKEAPVLATFCGGDTPYPVQSTGREMLIRWRTDESNYSDGWILYFQSYLEPLYCSGDSVALSEAQGSFASDVVDGPYQPNASCGWEITLDSELYEEVYVYFDPLSLGSTAQLSVTVDREQLQGPGLFSIDMDVESTLGSIPVFISQSNRASIQFHGQDSFGEGFVGHYCGLPEQGFCNASTSLQTERGEFNNHFCGMFYEGNADCEWVIAPQHDSDYLYTMLFFTSFDMNNVDGEVMDSVSVYENHPTFGWELLATLSQSKDEEIDAVFVSSASSMKVQFESDDLNTGEGFDAVYCTLTRDNICSPSQTLSDPQGEFNNYACHKMYGAQANCGWSALGKSFGTTAIFIIENLQFGDTAYSSSAGWGDNLRVYVDGEIYRTFNAGGEHDAKADLNEQTGTPYSNPIVISIPQSDIDVKFTSDSEGFAEGFNATYCLFGLVDNRICSGTTRYTQMDGVMNSGGCNGYYQPNANCSLLIEPSGFVPFTHELLAFVTRSNMASGDQLSIFEESKKLVEFNSTYSPSFYPAVYSTLHSSLRMNFTTDAEDFDTGFEIVYCTVESPASTCGSNRPVYTATSGRIRDHSCGPTYIAPLSCQWILSPDSPSPFNVLIVVFSSLSIDSDATLELWDSNNSLLYTSAISGGNVEDGSRIIDGSAFYLSDGQAVVHFDVENGATLHEGWEVQYFISNSTGKCASGVLSQYTDLQGTVEDHLYGNYYENNLQCEFLIELPEDTTITVWFEQFSLENGYDFLEVYDGDSFAAPLIGYFSGQDLPGTYTSSSNSLYFIFTTDVSVVDRGFKMGYSQTSLLPCPFLCSGFGSCNETSGVCSCEPGRYGLGCEIASPPYLKNVEFTDSLEIISVEFSRETNRAGMVYPNFPLKQIHNCSLILENLEALGHYPECVWETSKKLLIRLGATPAIDVGDYLVIRGNVIQEKNPSAYSPFAGQMSAPISSPKNFLQPTTILVGPNTLNIAEFLEVDASSSYLHGGRPMTYQWTLDFCDYNGTTYTCRTPPASVVEHVSSFTDALLTVPVALLRLNTPGSWFRTSAVCTNFVGTAGTTAELLTHYTTQDAPRLTIVGPSTRRVARGESLLLRGRVSLPLELQTRSVDMTCPDISMEWSIVWCESQCPSIDEETKNTMSLYVEPRSLEYNRSYRYRLTVTFNEQVGSPSSTSDVEILVNPMEFLAKIGGGDRTVSKESPLDLSATVLEPPLEDLPSNGATVQYRWHCRKQSGSACAKVDGALLQMDEMANITVPENTLPPGDYFFTLFANVEVDKLVLESRDRISVRVLRRSQTPVSVNSLLSEIKHDPRLPLPLSGVVGTASNPISESDIAFRRWSISDGDLTLVPGVTTINPNDSPSVLVMAPRALSGGAYYRFKLEALAQSDQYAGDAELSILVNGPPSGGVLSVTPSSGSTLHTEFLFQCIGSGDSEEDMPLKYVYGITPVSCAATAAVQQIDTPEPEQGACPDIPLSNIVEFPSFNTILPAGEYFAFVEVFDRFGASTRVQSTEKVTVYSDCPSNSDLLSSFFSTVVQNTNTYFCLGDFDAVMQMAQIASQTLLCVDFDIPDSIETSYQEDIIGVLTEVDLQTHTTQIYLDNLIKFLFKSVPLILDRFSSQTNIDSTIERTTELSARLVELGLLRTDSAGAMLNTLSKLFDTGAIPISSSQMMTDAIDNMRRALLQNRYCDNLQQDIASGSIGISARRVSSSSLLSSSLSSPVTGASPLTVQFELPGGVALPECIDYQVVQVVSPIRPASPPLAPRILGSQSGDFTIQNVVVEGLPDSEQVRGRIPKIDVSNQLLPSFTWTPQCVYWSEEIGDWVQGCTLTGEDSDYYYFESTHLTSFSVLFEGGDGGGGGGGAPPLPSSFGSFASDFSATQYFESQYLNSAGNLVSSFTQFSDIPINAFDTSNAVYDYLAYSPNEDDDLGEIWTDPITILTWVSVASALVIVIAAVIVMSIPPIRKRLSGQIAREKRTQRHARMKREMELQQLTPSGANYFMDSSSGSGSGLADYSPASI